MFKKIMCVLFVLMFMVVGCEQATFNEINVSTLDEIDGGGDNIQFIDGTLMFEIPSEKEYNKSKYFIQETLSKYFVEPHDMQLVKHQMKTFVSVVVNIPILKERDNDGMVYYFTYDYKALYLNLSPYALSQLNNEMKEAFSFGINSFSDINFTVILKNDVDTGVKISTPNVFVNNESVRDGSKYELLPGDKIAITCSNAMVDLASKEPVKVFTF